MENDINRAVSCRLYNVPFRDSQVQSVYNAAAFSIAQLDPQSTSHHLKKAFSKPPSSDLINIWREMHDRELFIDIRMILQSEEYIKQYKKLLPNFKHTSESERLNQIIIQSSRGKIMPSSQVSALLDPLRKEVFYPANKLPFEERKALQELLFKDYVNIVWKRQNYEILPLILTKSKLGDTRLIDLILPMLDENHETNDRGFSFSSGDATINGIRSHLTNLEFKDQFLKKIKKYSISENLWYRLLENKRDEHLDQLDLEQSLAKINNGNFSSKTSALHEIKEILNSRQIDDQRISAPTIAFLRSLNIAKDIPAEDWIHQNGQTNDSPLVYPMMAWAMVTQNVPNNYPVRLDAIEVLEMLVDRKLVGESDRKEAISVLMSIYKNWNSVWQRNERAQVVRLIRKLNESEKVDRTAQLRTQQLFYLETGILGTIGLTSLILLLLNLRLRNPFALFWSTYLIFPEEVVAELIALKQRRQTENVKLWKIKLELAYEILILIWAFQIQIRIDDLKLPPGGNRSAR